MPLRSGTRVRARCARASGPTPARDRARRRRARCRSVTRKHSEGADRPGAEATQPLLDRRRCVAGEDPRDVDARAERGPRRRCACVSASSHSRTPGAAASGSSAKCFSASRAQPAASSLDDGRGSECAWVGAPITTRSADRIRDGRDEIDAHVGDLAEAVADRLGDAPGVPEHRFVQHEGGHGSSLTRRQSARRCGRVTQATSRVPPPRRTARWRPVRPRSSAGRCSHDRADGIRARRAPSAARSR